MAGVEMLAHGHPHGIDRAAGAAREKEEKENDAEMQAGGEHDREVEQDSQGGERGKDSISAAPVREVAGGNHDDGAAAYPGEESASLDHPGGTAADLEKLGHQEEESVVHPAHEDLEQVQDEQRQGDGPQIAQAGWRRPVSCRA